MKTPENKDLRPENEDPKMQTPQNCKSTPKKLSKNKEPHPPSPLFLIFFYSDANSPTI